MGRGCGTDLLLSGRTRTATFTAVAMAAAVPATVALAPRRGKASPALSAQRCRPLRGPAFTRHAWQVHLAPPWQPCQVCARCHRDAAGSGLPRGADPKPGPAPLRLGKRLCLVSTETLQAVLGFSLPPASRTPSPEGLFGDLCTSAPAQLRCWAKIVCDAWRREVTAHCLGRTRPVRFCSEDYSVTKGAIE